MAAEVLIKFKGEGDHGEGTTN